MTKAFRLGTSKAQIRPQRLAVIKDTRINAEAHHYSVIVEQHNYCGRSPNGMRVSWAVVKSGLSFDDAVKLWEKRVG